MDTNELEAYIKKSIKNSPKLNQLSEERVLCFAVTGLNEEAGEVAGLLCREVYKKADMPEYKWLEELGDVLWYLIAATISKGMTLEELWQYNVEKLEGRYGELR
jgi:NTP pyrophosphatase (non-canonical NTP hydrolase)